VKGCTDILVLNKGLSIIKEDRNGGTEKEGVGGGRNWTFTHVLRVRFVRCAVLSVEGCIYSFVSFFFLEKKKLHRNNCAENMSSEDVACLW